MKSCPCEYSNVIISEKKIKENYNLWGFMENNPF